MGHGCVGRIQAVILQAGPGFLDQTAAVLRHALLAVSMFMPSIIIYKTIEPCDVCP